MSDNYVESNEGVIDIHYSREDGTKINWLIDEVEKDSENRYFLTSGITIMAVLENTVNGWVAIFMVETEEVGQVGLPDSLAEDIIDTARKEGIMV